jgi:hypothetical protein
VETTERWGGLCEPHRLTAAWAERRLQTGRHDGFPLLEARLER